MGLKLKVETKVFKPRVLGFPMQSAPVIARGGTDPSLAKWEMDSADLIETLEHDLKGEVPVASITPDGKTRWTWDSKSKPELTEKGLRDILTILRLHIPKQLWNSDLTIDEITDLLFELNASLAGYFFLYSTEAGISLNKASLVIENIMAPCTYSLRAVKDAGYRKDKNKFTEEHRIIDTETQHQPGGLSSLFRGGRREGQ